MSISIRLTCYIVGLFLAALTLLTTAKKSLNNLRIARVSLDELLIKMLLTVKLITSIVLDFEHCANATVLIALFYLLYFKLLLFFAAAKLNRTLNAFIALAVFEPAVQCVRI
ncbi:hypothetical protein GQX74_009537 [Glossina fuscipes]|nr:hypothetical protein GQX74_009537 [Glossina fuscipes]